MLWFNKFFKPKDIEHPIAPVMSHKGPKAYYEYFTHNGPDTIWWEARAYIPMKQEDGTFKTDIKTVQSPASSIARARHAAQQWGLKTIEENMP
jgi:hypothetical protein